MNQLMACRVCLAYDIQLYSISGGQLRDIYEKFTETSLETGDIKPTCVCYICVSLLKKFHKFIEKSKKSDQLLQQIINSGVELSVNLLELFRQQQTIIPWNLGKSQMVHDGVISATEEEVDIETPSKTEYVNCEMDMWDQNEDDFLLEVTNQDSSSDSEDNMTLQNISKQRKGDCHEKETNISLKRSNASEIKAAKKYKLEIDIEGNSSLNEAYLPVQTEFTFDYQKQCLLCKEDASDDFIRNQIRKHQGDRIAVCRVTKQGTGETIIRTCLDRIMDKHKEEVRKRVYKKDLVTLNARYHKLCYTKFLNPRNSTYGKRGRPISKDIQEKMEHVYEYIDSNMDETQFTIEELRKAVDVELPGDKTLKRKLIEHYGSNISIVETKGKPLVFCLISTAKVDIVPEYELELHIEGNSSPNEAYISSEVQTGVTFDYQKQCLLCKEDASDDFIRNQIRKHQKDRISVCRVTKQGTGETIIRTCLDGIMDEHKEEVRKRVYEKDLVTLNARYHKLCYTKFLNHRNSTYGKRGRPISEDIQEKMEHVYEYIDSNIDETQFTIEEL